jgi:uncharacterized ferritin-like protein (DUF455 family)
LANIEQYAIDLAWDIIARFADFEVNGERLPVEYFLDWAKVAEDEAKHFTLLSKRLGVSSYCIIIRCSIALSLADMKGAWFTFRSV